MRCLCMLQLCMFVTTYVVYFAIVVAPSNFRYTGIASNSIIFQWNSLSVNGTEVSWYVIICSRGNFSFTVSIKIRNVCGPKFFVVFVNIC